MQIGEVRFAIQLESGEIVYGSSWRTMPWVKYREAAAEIKTLQLSGGEKYARAKVVMVRLDKVI